MKCGKCGSESLLFATRQIDVNSISPVVSGSLCATCGDFTLDASSREAHNAALQEQRRLASHRLIALGGAAPEMPEIPRRHQHD